MQLEGYQKIKLLGGADVWINFNSKQIRCRACGKPMYFGVTKNNKNIPITRSGSAWQAHFADCPKANNFRRSIEVEENQKALSEF